MSPNINLTLYSLRNRAVQFGLGSAPPADGGRAAVPNAGWSPTGYSPLPPAVVPPPSS